MQFWYHHKHRKLLKKKLRSMWSPDPKLAHKNPTAGFSDEFFELKTPKCKHSGKNHVPFFIPPDCLRKGHSIKARHNVGSQRRPQKSPERGFAIRLQFPGVHPWMDHKCRGVHLQKKIPHRFPCLNKQRNCKKATHHPNLAGKTFINLWYKVTNKKNVSKMLMSNNLRTCPNWTSPNQPSNQPTNLPTDWLQNDSSSVWNILAPVLRGGGCSRRLRSWCVHTFLNLLFLLLGLHLGCLLPLATGVFLLLIQLLVDQGLESALRNVERDLGVVNPL